MIAKVSFSAQMMRSLHSLSQREIGSFPLLRVHFFFRIYLSYCGCLAVSKCTKLIYCRDGGSGRGEGVVAQILLGSFQPALFWLSCTPGF